MVNLKYFVGHKIKLQIMNTKKNSECYAVLSEKKLRFSKMCLVLVEGGGGRGWSLNYSTIRNVRGCCWGKKAFYSQTYHLHSYEDKLRVYVRMTQLFLVRVLDERWRLEIPAGCFHLSVSLCSSVALILIQQRHRFIVSLLLPSSCNSLCFFVSIL